MEIINCSQHLRFEAVLVRELTNDQLSAWKALILKNNSFSSPFFSPGYSSLVGQCVKNIMAGLIIKDNEIVGVFPYELKGNGEARPVGTIFCDYQGVIVRPDISWCAEDLLAGFKLDSWHFDHLIASQSQWIKYHKLTDVSWSIDLSSGFDAYEARLRAAKRGLLAGARRKWRMLEREVGPVSFSSHFVDHALLDKLLSWKSEQWEKSGWPGRFSSEWEQKLMHNLLETDQADFGGVFSVLRAGGQPISMHIGMRSRHVLHYWTTGYDPKFKRYSPGILMIIEILRNASKIGITEFDMGKEDFEYKRRLHTHLIPVAEGVAYGT